MLTLSGLIFRYLVAGRLVVLNLIFFNFLSRIERKRETSIFVVIYLCIQWLLLACALMGIKPATLLYQKGVLNQLPSQLSFLTILHLCTNWKSNDNKIKIKPWKSLSFLKNSNNLCYCSCLFSSANLVSEHEAEIYGFQYC